MDYMEKAKYELILGIKNNEPSDIINVLSQYYKDIVDIVKNIDNIKKLKHTVKFILNIYNENTCERLFFSDEIKLKLYIEKFNKDQIEKLTLNVVDNIDSDIVSYEIPLKIWKNIKTS